MKKFAKGIAAVGATVIAAIAAALADDNFTRVELINTMIVACSAVGVVIVPDLEAGVARHAKAIVAGLGAALALLVTLISDGVSASEWLQVLVAGLAALGIPALPGPKHPVSSPRLASSRVTE